MEQNVGIIRGETSMNSNRVKNGDRTRAFLNILGRKKNIKHIPIIATLIRILVCTF